MDGSKENKRVKGSKAKYNDSSVDRQTDRQMVGWMEGKTDGQIDRQTRQIKPKRQIRQIRQKDRRTERWMDIKIDRWIDRQIGGQMERQKIDRQVGQIDGQVDWIGGLDRQTSQIHRQMQRWTSTWIDRADKPDKETHSRAGGPVGHAVCSQQVCIRLPLHALGHPVSQSVGPAVVHPLSTACTPKADTPTTRRSVSGLLWRPCNSATQRFLQVSYH